MKIPQVMKLVDDLVFSQTGEHLNYLQQAIINGTLEQKSYTEIASEINSSESHVKNTGSELWQILSDALGENITKKTLNIFLIRLKFFLILVVVEIMQR